MVTNYHGKIYIGSQFLATKICLKENVDLSNLSLILLITLKKSKIKQCLPNFYDTQIS